MKQRYVYHNSHLQEYRDPFGAVTCGTEITLSILAYKEMNVNLYIIDFQGKVNKYPMIKKETMGDDALFEKKIDTTNLFGVINYYFSLERDFETVYYGNNEKKLGGEGKLYNNNPIPYQVTVYNKQYIPEWYKSGVIYQIFVDRFYNGNDNGSISCPKKNCFIYGLWSDEPMYIRSNDGSIERWDFYGGNLRGVIKKLDYIRGLGATIIYLNPIFEATSCHKYDTGDYEKIDSMFGTEDDFKELCKEAEKRGMKIILDGVFSHTGADSKYFNKLGSYDELGAYQSKESKYYSWYRFFNYPTNYECWWGIDNQPNVDELNESYIDYIIRNEDSIIRKWIKLGASGWRLDVADELPDKFIELIKSEMRKLNNESILIGEVWEDASNKVSYSERRNYLLGEELDSVTNFPLRTMILQLVNKSISLKEFCDKILSLYENYPIEIFYSCMNLLGNHDTERVLSSVGNDLNKLSLAVILQMTLPGVPLIFYGDEAGLLGEKDPSNRKTYPWGKENKDVYYIYKEALSYRVNEDVLKKGDFKVLENENNVLCFKRALDKEEIIIMINFSDFNEELLLPCYMCEGEYEDLVEKRNVNFNENRRIVIKSKKFKLFKKLI